MAPPTKEVACTFKSGCLITSGGGFSGFYARPGYQNDSKLVEARLPLPRSHCCAATADRTATSALLI